MPIQHLNCVRIAAKNTSLPEPQPKSTNTYTTHTQTTHETQSNKPNTEHRPRLFAQNTQSTQHRTLVNWFRHKAKSNSEWTTKIWPHAPFGSAPVLSAHTHTVKWQTQHTRYEGLRTLNDASVSKRPAKLLLWGLNHTAYAQLMTLFSSASTSGEGDSFSSSSTSLCSDDIWKCNKHTSSIQNFKCFEK